MTKGIAFKDLNQGTALATGTLALTPLVAARYHLGVAHYQRGQKAEAAAAFRRALELGKFSEEDAARKLLRELGG